MEKKFRVMKFGGTSVGDAVRMRAVAHIIQTAALSSRPVVVVSAVAGVTNMLIDLAESRTKSDRASLLEKITSLHMTIAHELELDQTLIQHDLKELAAVTKKSLGKKLSPARKDTFVSFGERLSATLLAGHLTRIGCTAVAFPAWEIGMITTADHGNAEPLPTSLARMGKKLRAQKNIPVVTGFIGKSAQGHITTLGRGGSDYTAALLGTALDAAVIQIWKEVDGIMTTDPRIVSDARVIRELAFEEASELAYFGAKVLHPKTILPAMKKGVPVQVLNTFKPEGRGTTIVNSYSERRIKSNSVEAFTFKKGVTILEVHSPEFFDSNGLMIEIFKIFHDCKTSVDVISTSVASVSVTIDSIVQLPKILKNLQKLGTVDVRSEKAIVCVVGGGIDIAGVAGKMFSTLKEHAIAVEMISQASSEISITFVVSEGDAVRSIQVLHKAFIT